MAKHNEIHPAASFGDLVRVVGYGDRVFMVEEFTVEYQHHPDGSITPNVVYDLTCPFTYDFIIGEQTDIAVVCKATTAHVFISNMEPYNPIPPLDFVDKSAEKIGKAFINLSLLTEEDVEQSKSKPKRKTNRQKQAEIDALLDELNVIRNIIEILGNDDDYKARIYEVKRKLKEVTK